MPDANLIMLFVYQVFGSMVLWVSTFVCAFCFILVLVVRVKETFFS